MEKRRKKRTTTAGLFRTGKGSRRKVSAARANVWRCMALAAVLSILFISHSLQCQSEETADVDEKYYSLLEEEYLDRVREVLKKEGYSNCGLTLTFSREAGGERSYTLAVHHRRFENLGEDRREEILGRVAQVPFGVKDCSFSPVFLDV